MKTMILGYKDPTQSIASTCPSLALTPRDLRDDATCTALSRASISLEARLKNHFPTCFQTKQATRSRCVSHAVLPKSVLWHNWQTEARLVLRTKPRNRFGNFETQITKPELPVLRHKPENPITLVLRLNQETCAPRLLMHGTDRTWRHPTYRSSGHRVPDLCLTIPDFLYHVSYSCLDHRRCPPCHTYHLHTTRQANTIFHTNKGNSIEPRKCLGFEFKHQHFNDSSQLNQETDHLVSQSPPWWFHWQQKAQSLNFKYKTHEAQLEDQNPIKAQEGHLKEGKPAKSTKGTKSDKPSQNDKEKLRKTQNQNRTSKKSSNAKSSQTSKTPPNTLHVISPSYIDIIMFLLSTTRLARVQPTLWTYSLPLAMNSSNTNWEKKEMLCMRSKLGCFTRYASKYLSNYTPSSYQDLRNKSESSQGHQYKITSK
jgi:hypothetical protein